MISTARIRYPALTISFVICIAAASAGRAQSVTPYSLKKTEITLQGLLVPNKTITLRAATSGIVIQDTVSVGQPVRPNQVLLTLDVIELGLQQQTLTAAQQHATNSKRLAQNGLDQVDAISRELQFGIQKATSIQNNLNDRIFFRQQKAAAASALNKLRTGMTQVNEKRIELDDKLIQAQQAEAQATTAIKSARAFTQFATKIKSPIAGVVSRSFVRTGDHVVRAMPLIEIIQIDPMQIVVWLPIDAVSKTNEISDVFVRPSSESIWRTASVRTLSPIIDQRTRRRPLLLIVANPTGQFVAGANVLVRFRSHAGIDE